jgi:class 3 adenylate cyclase
VAELRHGTLTFVFTDIEGSTGLVRRLRAAYPGVRATHRRLLREPFARHSGEPVVTH